MGVKATRAGSKKIRRVVLASPWHRQRSIDAIFPLLLFPGE
jgi:hypothetical protein